MHFHQDIEIVYVLDGTLEIEFEGSRTVLETDDFMVVNSNVRHSWTLRAGGGGDVVL